jgi:peptidoglycan/LPS O-acetylase OafA/YrhL
MNKKAVTIEGGHQRHIPGIDGLRTLAVLSVLIFHLHAAALPGGFSGVDVFFVISGYVVSVSLAKQSAGDFREFLLGFYARRIRRIYPALVVCLLGAALLQSLVVPVAWLSASSNKTGLLAFFGLSNFGLIWFNDGYFSPRVEFNPFTHTWSLGVEEQFYLLFPFILWFWLKCRDEKGLVGRLANAILPLLLIASLAFSWYETLHAPDKAYYLLPSRFWELGCGAMLFKLHSHRRLLGVRDSTKGLLTASGIALIGIGFVCAESKSFPFPWATPSVVGVVLAIAGVVSRATDRTPLNRLLSSGPFVYIGKLSYSLYLWHWPIIVMFRWTVGMDTLAKMIAAALLALAASMFSYHVIERPFRGTRSAATRRDGRVVALGAISIGLAAAAALGIFLAQPYLSLSVTRNRTEWYPQSWPAAPGAFDVSGSAWRQRKMFVVGDSHAEAYSTMLQMLTDREGAHVEQFSQPSCAVAGLLKPQPRECAPKAEAAIRQVLSEAAPGDIVFLASLRITRLEGERPAFDVAGAEIATPRLPSPTEARAAEQEGDAIVGLFERAGLKVIVDAPMPVFGASAFRCSDTFNEHNPGCRGGMSIDRRFLQAYRTPVMASLTALAQAHPNLVVWDPFPILCPTASCSVHDERGAPLFFDGDHLSAHGNRVLYPSFLATVARAWGPPRSSL